MPEEAAPIIGADPIVHGRGLLSPLRSPINGTVIGQVSEASEALASAAMRAAQTGFSAWSSTPLDVRAAAVESASDTLESNRGVLIAPLPWPRNMARGKFRGADADEWAAAAIAKLVRLPGRTRQCLRGEGPLRLHGIVAA